MFVYAIQLSYIIYEESIPLSINLKAPSSRIGTSVAFIENLPSGNLAKNEYFNTFFHTILGISKLAETLKATFNFKGFSSV